MTTPPSATTVGVQTFADCGEGKSHLKLFRINAGVPLREAIQHAATLLDCATYLSLEVAMDPMNVKSAFAACYLCEMSKAVLDDLELAMPSG